MNYQHIAVLPPPLYSFSFRCFWVFAQTGVGTPPTPYPRPMKIGYIFMFYLPGSLCLVACLLELFISRPSTGIRGFFSGLKAWFAMTIVLRVDTTCLYWHYPNCLVSVIGLSNARFKLIVVCLQPTYIYVNYGKWYLCLFSLECYEIIFCRN